MGGADESSAAPSIAQITYRFGGARWLPSPMDALREGLADTVSVRVVRADESVEEELLPALDMLEDVTRRELCARLEALRTEDVAETASASLERAIAARQEALAADDRLRRSSWLVDRARTLTPNADTDALLFSALHHGRRARREASRARAAAFAHEGMAELLRDSRAPMRRRHRVPRAIEALVWSLAWASQTAEGADAPGGPRPLTCCSRVSTP